MQRENRYLVVKRKDAEKFLTDEEREQLAVLADKVDTERLRGGRHTMCCVVIEQDWPEYEQVWQMVETRVDSTAQLLEQAKNLQHGLSRAEFHDKAWALYHAKRINSTMLENASIHEIRNIFDSIYDALFVT